MNKIYALFQWTLMAGGFLFLTPSHSQSNYLEDIIMGCESGNLSLEVLNAEAGQIVELEDPSSVDSIVFIGFSRNINNLFPDSWSFSNSISTVSSSAGLIMTYDIRRYFATIYGASTFITGSAIGGMEDSAHPYSYTAYVFRSGSNYSPRNLHVSYSQEYLQALSGTNCEQKVVALAETNSPRNMDVTVIVDDVDFLPGCAKAGISVSAGNVSYYTEAHFTANSLYGAHSHIHKILLENVPEDASQVIVDVCSIFDVDCTENGGAGQGLSFQGILVSEEATCANTFTADNFYFACDESENVNMKVISGAVQNDLLTCISLSQNNLNPDFAQYAEIWLFGKGTVPSYIQVSNDIGYSENIFTESVLGGGAWEFRTTIPATGADDFCVKTFGNNQDDIRVFSVAIFSATTEIQSISGELSTHFIEQKDGTDDCYQTNIPVAPGAIGIRDIMITIGLEAVYDNTNLPIDVSIEAGPIQFFQTLYPTPLIPSLLQAGQLNFAIPDVPGYVEQVSVNICSSAAQNGGAIYPSYIYVNNTSSCHFPEIVQLGCANFGEHAEMVIGDVPSLSDSECIDLNVLGYTPESITSMRVWAFTNEGIPDEILFTSGNGLSLSVTSDQVWNVGGQGTYYVADMTWDGSDSYCITVIGNTSNTPVSFGAIAYSEGNWNDGGVTTVFMTDYLYHGGLGNDCYDVIIPLSDSQGTSNMVDISFAIEDFRSNGLPVDFSFSYDAITTHYTRYSADQLQGNLALFNFTIAVSGDITEILASVCSEASNNGQAIYPTAVVANASSGCCLGQVEITTDGDPNHICQLDFITLFASETGFPEGSVFKWYRNGSYILWGDGPSIIADNFNGTSDFQDIEYTVRVTKPNGCTVEGSIMLHIIPHPALAGMNDGVVNFCIGDLVAIDLGIYVDDAFILDIVPLSGDVDALPSCTDCLNFTVMPSETTTYQVFVDYFGCVNTYFYTLVANTLVEFSLSTNITESLCPGETIMLTGFPNGSLPPGSTLQWYRNSQAIIGADEWTYTAEENGYYVLRISFVGGCYIEHGTQIIIREPFEIEEDITSMVCASQNSGSIFINIMGNNPGPFSFMWNDGYTGQNRSGLSAGTYNLTVSDPGGCSLSESYTLLAPTGLNIYAVATPQLMANTCTSMASANVTGGVGPYSYLWDDPAGQGTQVAMDLCPGTYEVIVTDFNGCIGEGVVIIEEVNCDLSINNSTVGHTCDGMSDGAIALDVTSTNGSIYYEWFYEGNSFPGNGSSLNNLSPGTYSVHLGDALGCVIDSSFTVTVYDALEVIPTINSTTCALNDGEINLNLLMDQFESIIWSDNEGVNNPHRTGLSAGNYSAVITDIHGCVADFFATVSSPSLSSCCVSFSLNAELNNIICNGENNGSIVLLISGGQEPYSISWSDGSSSPERSKLFPGIYTVVVSDDNGCLIEASYTIIQQPLVSLELVTAISPTCENKGGVIETEISGGTGAYTYQWSDDELQTGDRENLAPGTYTLIVYDSNGCMDMITVNLSDPGSCTGSIGDMVFMDENENGLADPDEDGLSGISIYCMYEDGTEISTNTDVNGLYYFENLEPGIYQVYVDWPLSNFIPTTALSYTINIAADENIENADFGFSISNMADLSLTKTATILDGIPGSSFAYNITLTNQGPSDATEIQVSDNLPDGLSFISASSSIGTYSEITSLWSIPLLSSGSSVTLYITTSILPGAANSIENTAQIVSVNETDPDSVPGNNNPAEDDQSAATIAVNPIPMANLSILKSVSSSQALSLQPFYYTIEITNSGPAMATDIEVEDVLPSGISYLGSSASLGEYMLSSSVWYINSLAPGESAILTIDVMPLDFITGVLTNTAEVIAVNESDPDSFPDNQNTDEDDQDSASVIIYQNLPCIDQTACTEPLIPILICPDFCNIDGDYFIQDAESTYQCSIELSGNCVLYTPLPSIENWGDDYVSIIGCTSDGQCETVIVTVTFGCNAPPTAVADYATSYGEPVAICVLANDYDPDNDGLTICGYTDPANGTLNFAGDCPVYTPDPGYYGLDCFTYTVCDNHSHSDIGTACIDVVNIPIPCENETIIACTDQMESIEFCPEFCNLSDNFVICDHQTLYNCSIIYLPGQCIRYTPLPAFQGSELITLTACDGSETDVVEILISVGNCGGTSPVAVDDYVDAVQATPLIINVLVNDSDAGGSVLSVCGYTNPLHGILIQNGNTFTYIAEATYVGSDSFTYTICNDDGDTDVATVFINVSPLCISEEPHYCVEPMTPLEICLDFCTPGAELTSVKTSFACSITILNDHCFRFLSVPIYSGVEILEVEACIPGNIYCETVYVYLTVGDCDGSGFQHNPDAQLDFMQTVTGSSVNINMLENDFDSDGDDIYICQLANPSYGTLVENGLYYTYTPDPGFVGTDYFTYQICDGNGGYDESVVTINVTGTVMNVQAVDDVITYYGGNMIVNVMENDLYPSICLPQLTILSQPTLGTLALNTNGSFTLNDIPFGYTGMISFTYRLCACNVCDNAVVSINVMDGNMNKNMFIPNAFTPNGDGVNDVFSIRDLEDCRDCISATLVVIDSRGLEVKKLENFLQVNYWDGKDSHFEELMPGTYFFLLELVYPNSREIIKGFVELRK